jgi:hypothetical protein
MARARQNMKSSRLVPSSLRSIWGLMPDLQFVSRLSSAFFVAKENDFGLREQQRPAFQRIALNDSVVAAEGFRGRKERQHFLLLVCSTSRANLLP